MNKLERILPDWKRVYESTGNNCFADPIKGNRTICPKCKRSNTFGLLMNHEGKYYPSDYGYCINCFHGKFPE
jgi:hypothetical protein